MSRLRRRDLFVAMPAAVAACSRPAAPRPEHRVSIEKVSDYSSDLFATMRRILIDHKVPVKGRSVLLKPNLVEFTSGTPVNTHAVFVAAVYEAFLALGAAKVTIAEGPGHRRITMDLADGAGYFGAVRDFERHFVDLNLDDVAPAQIDQPFSALNEIYLPKTVLGCDLLVSIPKMKTHHWVGATLAMKNLFGLVPGNVYGWPKNVLHWAGIDECIADLNLMFPRQFCIVDGIEAMQGNGPILGASKRAGVVVAGAHPPSVDATCCRIMGIDPSKIQYLKLIGKRTGWRAEDIRQSGERVESVYQAFDLPPGFESFRLNPGGRT